VGGPKHAAKGEGSQGDSQATKRPHTECEKADKHTQTHTHTHTHTPNTQDKVGTKSCQRLATTVSVGDATESLAVHVALPDTSRSTLPMKESMHDDDKILDLRSDEIEGRLMVEWESIARTGQTKKRKRKSRKKNGRNNSSNKNGSKHNVAGNRRRTRNKGASVHKIKAERR